MKEQQDQWRYDPGAVVAIALILERAHSAELWSINVGDSAILLLQDREVVQVTEEASLKTYRFRKGVECRGGMVGEVKPFGLRVLSESAIPNFARSIGDLDVPGLTPRGKVQRIRIHPSATAIVGCDGVFENLSYLQVGKKCQDLLSNPQVHVAGELALYAYKMGSPDNISCIVAQIRSKQ